MASKIIFRLCTFTCLFDIFCSPKTTKQHWYWNLTRTIINCRSINFGYVARKATCLIPIHTHGNHLYIRVNPLLGLTRTYKFDFRGFLCQNTKIFTDIVKIFSKSTSKIFGFATKSKPLHFIIRRFTSLNIYSSSRKYCEKFNGSGSNFIP